MAFLKSLSSAVGDLVRKATGPTDPYQVNEISLQSISRCTILSVQGSVTLLKDGSAYVAIVKVPGNKIFRFASHYIKSVLTLLLCPSLFHLASENEATTFFSNVSYKLEPLLQSTKYFNSREGLEKFSNSLREHPTWTCAHLAAFLGCHECFRHESVKQMADTLDETLQTSPVQLAVESEDLETIQELLIAGVNLTLADHEGNNVFHYAAKAKNPTITQYLASKDPSAINQLNLFGESALHIACLHDQHENAEQLLRWGAQSQLTMSHRFPIHCAMKVASVQCIQVLCHWSKEQMHVADSRYGGTPMHWARSKECINVLADLGCNLEAPNTEGETALHIMIKRNRLECVMALLSRGARAEAKGCHDNSTLHMAIEVGNADMLQALIVFGADINSTNKFKASPRHAAKRILCLDGGGIRGLVLIQILLALERVVGQPVRNCFDWIGGTSTGGILALAIVHGKSMRYAQGLYFRLKDEVFTGSRPYNSEPLEKFMKREFGPNTRMTEVEYPKVIVTGVLGDRSPAELHMFRNYERPGEDFLHPTDMFEPVPRPTDQHVWRAARCSGAAPTYFRAFGNFLDGGLIANNPTLDVMTEVHEYNMALKATGKGDTGRPMHVVVSLGTGRTTPKKVAICDVYRPEGLFDIAKVTIGAKNLSQLLMDQITMADGRPVERARAWCSMIGVPYVRICPQLSADIPLDCSEDAVLVNMLWETQCYLHKHHDRLARLAALLWP
ncbi:hypothetical protein CAPTEDRAFT_216660 [Capitella teleta]|uniref:phospholipase A2 n=1 Tax=Capitella teleta TaxID=283909 RepID=R7TB24_CAPTE|nr:hypothetical protein CAPTEDRAFT_216660 [Capitella teleta]|eukprot:ELT90707.1 hypothetical protein CAPTEDRAFT_216660 [Capitella teleta]